MLKNLKANRFVDSNKLKGTKTLNQFEACHLAAQFKKELAKHKNKEKLNEEYKEEKIDQTVDLY